MPDVIIRTDKLSKRYGPQSIALDNLSLTIRRGEVFGFLGHNGAGKTTAIHILTTLLEPTSGSAQVCGKDVRADRVEVRRHIGYLPESVRLYDSMTARANLRFFGKLSGVADLDRRIDEMLGFLGCEELAEQRVGTFSKGMRQRIGLAQAALHRPEVLFLDEPTSGLDPLGVKTLRDLIGRLGSELGITIFMNTHLISEIAKTCTTIGVLNHGRLVFHDSIRAITTRFGDEAALEDLYLSVTPAAPVGAVTS